MQSKINNVAALLSVIGIGLQAIVCFMVAEGPISGFHLGLFGAASLAYLGSLILALRTSLWVSALLIAVLSLFLDLTAFYSVFIAPTSSTEALSLLVVPLVKLLGIVPFGLIVGVLVRVFGGKAA